MRTVTAGLLGVIAAGVMVIAFELMPSRTVPAPMDVNGQMIGLTPRMNMPVTAGPDQIGYYGSGSVRPVPIGYYDDASVRRPSYQSVSYAPRRTTSARYERPKRDWAKTALVIGGTTAAGAGVGAILGGSKGAIIGAALAGGAGTLFEVNRGR